MFFAFVESVMKNTFTLESAYDGLGISVMTVAPDDVAPHAVLELSHGMRGCKERFLPFMEYMAGQGIACVAWDHRGHGASVRSVKDLGYMYDGGYQALVEDVRLVTDWTHDSYPGLPVFLLGHSMGSMAVRVFVKKHDPDLSGLILCGSPGWNPAASFGRMLSRMMCLVSGGRYRPLLIPMFQSAQYNRRFSHEGPLAWTCSDPLSRKAFAENPLCRFRFTANANLALLDLMLETHSESGWHSTHSAMPVYFISGEDDPCMAGESRLHESALKMCRAGYTDVTSAIFPAMRHEVLNETAKETVWNDIRLHIESWLGHD